MLRFNLVHARYSVVRGMGHAWNKYTEKITKIELKLAQFGRFDNRVL